MPDHSKIDQLLQKLDALLQRQNAFAREIDLLREEIGKLTSESTKEFPAEKKIEVPTVPTPLGSPEPQAPSIAESPTNVASPEPVKTKRRLIKPPKVRSDLENFIGENLFSKIGIVILVIGVAIGAKYAIDRELISPLTRIILGYLVGLGLLGFAFRLKPKYPRFSAVLLSGAMTILYVLTYFAYDFYGLIPQLLAFGLMVVFTAFTVFAAVQYDRQIIALLGLVGAYAVPFLLSSDSGNARVLFTYMTIVNTGVLLIAFRKYWKPVFYSAFVLTWLIYAFWAFTDFDKDENFGTAMIFALIFFALFYLTFLAYKLIKKEKFSTGDIALMLANAFIFYGFGYGMISDLASGEELLGLFTLTNAVIHFGVALMVYRRELADRNLFYFLSGLVLVFLTIAIPVQLDGNWVTLLWAGEAALLFWIGRTKGIALYEKLSYPLMLLAFFSLGHDWMTGYSYSPRSPESRVTPLFNIHFMTSVLVIAAYGFINYLFYNNKYPSPLKKPKGALGSIMSIAVPALLFFTVYLAFRVEIESYWTQLYKDSDASLQQGDLALGFQRGYSDLLRFKEIWIINYTLFFLAVLSFINIRYWKVTTLSYINLILNVVVIAGFLVAALFQISLLRDSYLAPDRAGAIQVGYMHIAIRYISYLFLGLVLYASYRYIRLLGLRKGFRMAFDLLFHLTILWVASSELIHWMDMSAAEQSYKLGLSILWGVYSLLLIFWGIRRKKRHLRIGAIALFAVTLVKLFVYDISQLNTIAKTVVFVSLGILLLLISYLYTRYKQVLFDDSKN